MVKKLFIAWFYKRLAQIDKKVHLKIINFNEVTKKKFRRKHKRTLSKWT